MNPVGRRGWFARRAREARRRPRRDSAVYEARRAVEASRGSPSVYRHRVRRTHRNAVTSAAVVIGTPSFPPSVSATWPSADTGG